LNPSPPRVNVLSGVDRLCTFPDRREGILLPNPDKLETLSLPFLDPQF